MSAAAAPKQFDFYTDDRLGELALYIAKRCAGFKHFGSVKLNKLLFYSDFVSFVRQGRPITGAEYVRQALGPCPSRIDRVRTKLIKSGRAVEQDGPRHNERRLVAVVQPSMATFTEMDRTIVDAVIQAAAMLTGTALSNKSHQFIGWRLAKTGEKIPYHTAFIPNAPLPLTPAQKDWAKSALARMNKAAAAA